MVYRLGDVLVLPSRGPGETWGLAVNEAMASERPAIVSDRVGCAPDLIVQDKTGAIFRSEDVEALTTTLRAMLDNRAKIPTMGVAAAAHISGWSIEKQADQMVTAIERLLAERARRRSHE
jgi:glycosyltransferase involved in cell wall biosynthesis